MDTKRLKQYKTKLINFWEKPTSEIEYYKKQESFLNEYIYQGKSEFLISYIEDGEEETVNLDLSDIIGDVGYIRIKKSATNFNNKKNEKTYKELTLQYHYYTMFFLEEISREVTETEYKPYDIVLTYFYNFIHFPENCDKLLDFFLKVMYHEDYEYLLSKKKMGFDSLYYLIAYFIKEVGNIEDNEKILAKVSNIHPAYEQAIKHHYSQDKQVVIDWINGLVEYHVTESKLDWTRPFSREQWQYYPIEILSLLTLRERKGLDNSFIKNPLLDDFLPYLCISFEVSEELEALQKRVMGQNS